MNDEFVYIDAVKRPSEVARYDVYRADGHTHMAAEAARDPRQGVGLRRAQGASSVMSRIPRESAVLLQEAPIALERTPHFGDVLRQEDGAGGGVTNSRQTISRSEAF